MVKVGSKEPVSIKAKVALIAAVARDRVIGSDGKLPWHFPQDLQHFRKLTLHHRVIMGRKTFDSIGKALPHRDNVIVTRNQSFVAPNCQGVNSLESALELPFPADGGIKRDVVFVIGGGELYQQAMPRAAVIWLTEIDCSVDGDTYFPIINRVEWCETERWPGTFCLDANREEVAYAFVRYQRC